jgi:hypothetical protein
MFKKQKIRKTKLVGAFYTNRMVYMKISATKLFTTFSFNYPILIRSHQCQRPQFRSAKWLRHLKDKSHSNIFSLLWCQLQFMKSSLRLISFACNKCSTLNATQTCVLVPLKQKISWSNIHTWLRIKII